VPTTTNALEALDAAAVQWGRAFLDKILWERHLKAIDTARVQATNPAEQAEASAQYRQVKERTHAAQAQEAHLRSLCGQQAHSVGEQLPLEPEQFEPITQS
jgi:hypothetical protein